ncbi:bifunctional glutamate/proline--tRNA ligase isoform X1 [Procambarus clarkii]|uniref:bifunctional glutamate/proline--tRNA ligase isoform X1 n=2 Tax=Procambarus clarkii TaxID=6728 RepID=UPI001E672EF3|nr:bifunctional glutamate/proline--tRNA ligase-like [Procambarus clarkii]
MDGAADSTKMKVIASKTDPPLGAVLTCSKAGLSVEFGKETNLALTDTFSVTSSHGISRHVARVNPSLELYPCHILHRTEVDHWLSTASGPLSCGGDINGSLAQLDKALAPSDVLVGNHITVADFEVFAALYKNAAWHKLLNDDKAPVHVLRWYNSMEAQVGSVIAALPEEVKKAFDFSKTSPASPNKSASNAKKQDDGGKFVELPGAKMGEVVVRFPPEASGYLHIGHAKAALLNQYYQLAFKGKLVMRFDDTNPEKEKLDFEKVILEDLKLLEIKPDVFTHTSDYFDRMIEMCEQLIKQGHAYCDDTDGETMKKEREERKESKNYNNSVDKNLSMWEEMKKGTDYGMTCCVRARIDMKSDNGCMRDPAIYRCKNEPHVKTGYKYKVYPTYDFACPIVDSIEGVTHTLRTTEYHDRDDQYYWFIEKLGLRTLHIYEYSRLNMNNTVLSKRKLTWFVDEGLVDGWDDPRFPTVRGILRRGMTVEGLKDFIISQGSSRSVVNMEWDKIWAFNKKVIDRYAPRYTALQGDLVPVLINGINEEATTAQKHPKDSSIGMKTVWIGPRVLIESADAAELKEGQNATFINWGNIRIKKINKGNGKIESIDAEPNLNDTDYKKTLKLTWLADTEKSPTTPVVCVYFDHLITKSVLGKDENFKDFIGHNTRAEVKMIGDTELQNLVAGDIIQLQRKGFFRVDEAYKPVSLSSCRESPVILFFIPDGHSKDMQTASSVKKSAGMSEKEKAKSAQGKKAEKSPQDEIKPVVGGASGMSLGQSLLNSIKDQGDKIRQLKSSKADKNVVMAEVEILKQMKKDFHDATGIEWKPDVVIPSAAAAVVSAAPVSVAGTNAGEILSQIKTQGDTVRNLKSNKADKDSIKQAVDILLDLKKKFKTVTGVEWKPDIDISKLGANTSTPPTPSVVSGNSSTTPTPSVVRGNSPHDLHNKIKEQGDKVRTLKTSKAEKDVVKQEVDILLSLKKEFKELTSSDWKPDIDMTQFSSKCDGTTASTASVGTGAKAIDLHMQIKQQGDAVRELKANKVDKDTVKKAVDVLLSLKKQFQECSGVAWKPDIDVSQFSKDDATSGSKTTSPKKEGGGEVKPKTVENRKTKEQSPVKNEVKGPAKQDGNIKKQTRLGLEVKKEQNLAEWYSQVITKSEMIEYYNVSGCYILRPWSYAIWDYIKDFLDKKIKTLGVENSYFPIFVAREALEKEKTHIADFSPEVAWVTRSGSSEMAEPVAIRPTSETVMYPAFAKWIQSHRDLPMKLNQWNNVVRWEFKQPTPFLRTREFLWQEGHTAFATKEEAEEEVYQILEFYTQVYEDLLAVPVVKGKKTEKEKFAGGDFTTTTEAFISASGRGIQGATSHHLGQNFSKMFEIIFEDPETQQKQYCYQNSWGLTTRTIGVMIMVHGDNKGLVLPPRVACVQAIIMPVGITAKSSEQDKSKLMDACNKLASDLTTAGVRARCDLRDNVTPAWKFNHWELKGVPLRLELGPREVATGQVFAVRRDTAEKLVLNRTTVGVEAQTLLDTIHNNLLSRARSDLDSHKVKVNSWSDFTSNLDKGNIILAPFCGQEQCEDAIKKDSAREETAEPGAPSMGAKGLCIPFEQPGEVNGLSCIHPSCKAKPLYYTLFGRSY